MSVKEVRMLDYFTQIVYTVGRIEKGIIHMLGTGFLVDNGRYIAVPRLYCKKIVSLALRD